MLKELFAGQITEDYLLSLGISVFLVLLFIVLFAFKQGWAKWVLSILLILNGVGGILTGLEYHQVFLVTGAFDIFFGIFLHVAKP